MLFTSYIYTFIHNKDIVCRLSVSSVKTLGLYSGKTFQSIFNIKKKKILKKKKKIYLIIILIMIYHFIIINLPPLFINLFQPLYHFLQKSTSIFDTATILKRINNIKLEKN